MEGTNAVYIPTGYVGEGLLEGCSDLHVHASPEIIPGPVDDVTTAKLAKDMGMRALLLKPFMWQTVRAAQLVEGMVPGIKVFGGVVLNVNIGGLDPSLVDAAGRLGGKAVWMPTWSAANDLKRGGFSKIFRKYVPIVDKYPAQGLTVLSEEGKLRPEVREIIRLVKQYDMILCTAHLSVHESKLVAKEAQACGLRKLIFSHPLSGSVGATHQDVIEMVEMGAYVEHCAIGTFPMLQHVKMSQILELLSVAGPEHTILTTDVTFPYNPPGPIMMQMFLASLIELGVSKEDIGKMVRQNTDFLLGLSD